MKDSNTPPAVSNPEGFLSRWSSRKQAANEASELSTADNAGESSLDESLLPTDDDMPPIESLEESSDYTGFLSPKVSDELRRLALRKLFQGAAFNTCDGLDDYAEDFTSFAKLGDLVTSDMRFQAEEEAKKRELEQASEKTGPRQTQENPQQAEAAEPLDEDPEVDNLTINDEFEKSEIEA